MLLSLVALLACPQTPEPELELFGKVNADWAFFDAEDGLESAVGDFKNGAEMRRVRLGVKGNIYDWLSLKLSADLADAEIRDAFFDLQGLTGNGLLRIGHFREPMGLSNQTPSSVQTFMERPLSTALFPSRNIGLAWQQQFSDQNLAWTAGVFRETDDAGVAVDGAGGNEVALTTRLTWLPYQNQAEQDLLHIGGSFSIRNPDEGMVQIDGGVGTVIGPSLVDTGLVQADQVILLGLEAAWKHGPTSVQAEFEYANIEQTAGGSPDLQGWYLEVSHFTTGETRPYQTGRSVFGRVEPLANFDPHGDALGAFEVGLRVSRLDLSDQSILGGVGMNIGVALNWYLTSHLRFQTNLIRADRDEDGSTNVLAFRFHLDF